MEVANCFIYRLFLDDICKFLIVSKCSVPLTQLIFHFAYSDSKIRVIST